MQSLETKEIRGLSAQTIIGVFAAWSTLLIAVLSSKSSIETKISENKKDMEISNKMLQYQIDNIRQTTELNSIQIQEIKNQRDTDHLGKE